MTTSGTPTCKLWSTLSEVFVTSNGPVNGEYSGRSYSVDRGLSLCCTQAANCVAGHSAAYHGSNSSIRRAIFKSAADACRGPEGVVRVRSLVCARGESS